MEPAIKFYSYWSFFYRTQPSGWKIHRNFHQYLYLAASIYLPYRFMHKIDTAFLSLFMSKNPYFNLVVKNYGRGLIILASVFAGQCLARLFWVYKRSYNATTSSVINTYLY